MSNKNLNGDRFYKKSKTKQNKAKNGPTINSSLFFQHIYILKVLYQIPYYTFYLDQMANRVFLESITLNVFKRTKQNKTSKQTAKLSEFLPKNINECPAHLSTWHSLSIFPWHVF